MTPVPNTPAGTAFQPVFAAGASASDSPPVWTPLDDHFGEGGAASALFPAGYAHDHPNETSAYLFADMVKLALEDSGALPLELSEPQVRRWCCSPVPPLPPATCNSPGAAQRRALSELAPQFSRWLQLPAL